MSVTGPLARYQRQRAAPMAAIGSSIELMQLKILLRRRKSAAYNDDLEKRTRCAQ